MQQAQQSAASWLALAAPQLEYTGSYNTRRRACKCEQSTNCVKQKIPPRRAASKKNKHLPAHATTKEVIYVFVTVASTRFRAAVQATSDDSRPLLTGAWESLSHRCRLPVQQDCTDARQELRSSQPSII